MGHHHKKHHKNTLKIISLGGYEEIGKNCTAIEYNSDLIIVDMGIQFPTDEMPGIDYVIPDINYIKQNLEKLKGVIITHGHLDHIGAIPYLAPELKMPTIYSMPLTLGLIHERLEEFNMAKSMKLKTIVPEKSFRLGKFFTITPFFVNHNIPDSVGFFIETPMGNIVHTGDFKIDQTPIDQPVIDLSNIGQYGRRGILALLSDSTNASIPGNTMSEREVFMNIDKKFAEIKGRIIFTSFSTLISRTQEVIYVCAKYNKKLAISGFSLEKCMNVAANLKKLTIPNNILIKLENIKKYSDNQVVILASGTQGEERSALSRMSRGKHRGVKIKRGDTVIFSSSPIPGNESAIHKVMNNLIDRGAKVIYEPLFGMHTSGHANQDDLRTIINLLRPKYFIPAHGEHYMQAAHIEIAESCGISRDNCFMLKNGNVIEFSEVGDGKLSPQQINYENIMVDGLGVGDVKNVVLRDRQTMSEAGVFVVIITVDKNKKRIINTDIISRGFVFMKESEKLIKKTREEADKIARTYIQGRGKKIDWSPLNNRIKDNIGELLYAETERRPMILPLIIEI